MNLVDNIYFIRCAQWLEIDMAFQVPYLVDASVRRSVYLYNIKVFTLGYRSAGFAFTARFPVKCGVLAVESFCDQAGS